MSMISWSSSPNKYMHERIGTTLAWTKHGRLTGQDEARKRV
ncbi:hypothetical protein HanHA89_Chr01g0000671 [Helianthus annuus]|nr:hypothetical protein HanHA89_Chr01g0000671 [Helianthus annuus]